MHRVKDRVVKDKQMHYETMRANEALKAIKAMEKQKELEEEQKMYEFARRKEQLVLERKVCVYQANASSSCQWGTEFSQLPSAVI